MAWIEERRELSRCNSATCGISKQNCGFGVNFYWLSIKWFVIFFQSQLATSNATARMASVIHESAGVWFYLLVLRSSSKSQHRISLKCEMKIRWQLRCRSIVEIGNPIQLHIRLINFRIIYSDEFATIVDRYSRVCSIVLKCGFMRSEWMMMTL